MFVFIGLNHKIGNNMLKLRELYYITHIDNLPSILKSGILCHRKIIEEQINFTPIYDEDIIASERGKGFLMGGNYGIL